MGQVWPLRQDLGIHCGHAVEVPVREMWTSLEA